MRAGLAVFLLWASISGLQAEVEVRIGSDRRAELDEVLVDCEVQGRLLVRRLELAFRNPGAGASEGELVCPLAPGERVVEYAMDVAGVRREGVVVPRNRARTAYEEIVRRRVDPGILEVDEEKGEFRTRVFPIPGGETKRVWITTVTVVGSGEVVVWPEGFGRPGRWKVEVSLSGASSPPDSGEWEIASAGAEEGRWTMSREGERSEMPACRIRWQADEQLVYRTADRNGADWLCQFIEPGEAKERADDKGVELWVDGAALIDPSAGKTLEALLASLGNVTVRLRLFRETVEDPEVFGVTDGRSEELVRRVTEIERRGMARPGALPWRDIEADAVVFLTDGRYPEGPAVVGTPSCPMHIVDSGAGTSAWLRSRAVASGGGWHANGKLDPLAARFSDVPDDALAAVHGEALMIAWRAADSEASSAMETLAARWLWAAVKCESLRQAGASQRDLDAFRYDYGVLDGSSAWLVLETAEDYAKYGFEPPRSEPKLHEQWEVHVQVIEESRQRELTSLAQRWNERCEILSAEQPEPGQSMLNAIARRVAFWTEQSAHQEDLAVADVQPMIELLAEVSKLAVEPVDAKKGRQLMECLDRMTTLETGLEAKLKVMAITVGGKVRRPGQFTLSAMTTLRDAVMAAGGPTEFGAISRVKLYRNGRSYSYDLEREDHAGVRIFPGDVIDVPQKNWLGNGGGTPGQKPPFASGDEAVPTIKVEASPWDPTRPCVRVLDDVMKADGDWRQLYRIQRGVYGWRADFYLDCLELFERRGMMDEAGAAARELADLDPDHPEVLRKAARALRRLGEAELSGVLFERIHHLSPDDEVACFDLARALSEAGESERAAKLLWEAVTMGEDLYRQGRRLVFLEELNALLERENLDGEALGIDARFIGHVPLDLRVVLDWDAEQSNVDLVVRDPFGDESGAAWFGSAAAPRRSFESGNVSRGFGPEGFSVGRALPGDYALRARFFGDWDEGSTSSVTAEIEVTRHFGTRHEARERFAVRLDEREDEEVARVRFTPAGWE